MPETAHLEKLWPEVDGLLSCLELPQKLTIAAEVITLLAEIHTARSHQLLTDWEDVYNETGPQADADFLRSMVRQTLHLDLEEAGLVKRPELARTRTRRQPTATDSIAGATSKEALLQMVTDLEQQKQMSQRPESVAEDERVG